jgi:hypothetical protein
MSQEMMPPHMQELQFLGRIQAFNIKTGVMSDVVVNYDVNVQQF